MAVAIVMEFDGATLDQYNQVVDRMGFSPGGAGPAGNLFHWVTKTDGGISVTDVWESREQFDAFAGSTIGPITREIGFPSPPQLSFHEVHNYLTKG